MCRYEKVKAFDKELELKFQKWQILKAPNGMEVKMHIDIYDNKNLKHYKFG